MVDIWILGLFDKTQRGASVISLWRGIKTVQVCNVNVQWHSSWRLCNPLVIPSTCRTVHCTDSLNIFCVVFFTFWSCSEMALHTARRKEQDYSKVERETSVWCIITMSIIRPFGPAQSTSLWSEDQTYLTSDDGQSALWIMMYDYRGAGEQTPRTFGSFTCERSICCKSTLSSLCYT